MTPVENISKTFDIESRQKRFVQYLLVGVLGVMINELVILLSTDVIGFVYVVGGLLGQVLSTVVNYAINDAWTWNERGGRGRKQWVWRCLKYVSTRLVGIGIHLVTLALLVELIGVHYLVANLIAMAMGMFWGFGASDALVWQDGEDEHRYISQLRAKATTVYQRIDRPTGLIIVGSILVFVFFSVYMGLLYRGYWLTGGDFGSYVHAFATTLDGTGFLHTGRYRVGNPTGAYWGEHFSITLLVVYPLYALVPSPYTLIVVKSFCLAASVPLVWLLARDQLESDYLSGLLTLSYALNPFLFSAWLFDFQEQIFLPLLVFLTYVAYRKSQYKTYLVLVALTLLTNEFMVIIMSGSLLGYVVISYRAGRLRQEWPIFVGFLGLLVSVHILAGVVIAQFNQFSGIPVTAIAEPLHPYISSRRVAASELMAIVLENPMLILETLTAGLQEKGIYLLLVLIPVGFLSLLDEFSLASIAPFLAFSWLFAGSSVYYTFGAHYPLYVLPFLYIGAIRVLRRLELPKPSKQRVVQGLLVVLVLNSVGIAGVVAEEDAVPQRTKHMQTLEAGLATIPDDASLVTQNEIYPHVADRPGALFVVSSNTYSTYQDHHSIKPVDYILFDTELGAKPQDWSGVLEQVYDSRLGEEYRLQRYQDGVFIFKRGYEGKPQGITGAYSPPTETYDARDLSRTDALLYNQTIVSERGESGDTVWFGPYDSLAPGHYQVTFLINVSSTSNEPTALLDVNARGEKGSITQRGISSTDGWEEVTVNFTLNRYQSDIEFRGFRMAEEGTIRLRAISVSQSPEAETENRMGTAPSYDPGISAQNPHSGSVNCGRYGAEPVTTHSTTGGVYC